MCLEMEMKLTVGGWWGRGGKGLRLLDPSPVAVAVAAGVIPPLMTLPASAVIPVGVPVSKLIPD